MHSSACECRVWVPEYRTGSSKPRALSARNARAQRVLTTLDLPGVCEDVGSRPVCKIPEIGMLVWTIEVRRRFPDASSQDQELRHVKCVRSSARYQVESALTNAEPGLKSLRWERVKCAARSPLPFSQRFACKDVCHGPNPSRVQLPRLRIGVLGRGRKSLADIRPRRPGSVKHGHRGIYIFATLFLPPIPFALTLRSRSM